MAILGIVGSILVFVGWIWAIIDAFKTSGVAWGIINIIPFQPLIGIISAAIKKISWKPVLIMVIGTVIWMVGGGMAAFSR